jgi:hypothetical protein
MTKLIYNEKSKVFGHPLNQRFSTQTTPRPVFFKPNNPVTRFLPLPIIFEFGTILKPSLPSSFPQNILEVDELYIYLVDFYKIFFN